MEGTYFFSGITVESDDLNNVQDVLSKQIKDRALDFFSKGILGNTSDVYVVNGLRNTINIQPFVALTPAGERVKVYKTIKSLALDLRNQDTEHRLSQQGEIPDEYFGWTPNIYYDIYVNYIEAYGSPRAHITSGEFYPTRINPGFEFYALRSEDAVVNTDGEPFLVKIARVFYDGQALQIYTVGNMDVSTIDGSKIKTTPTTTKTTYYAPTYNPTTLQDHVMCIGSGTPSEKNPHGLSLADFGADATSVHDHEKNLHSSGIIADRSSLESALYIQLNHRTLTGETDSLILYNFTEKEFVQHRGDHASYIYKAPVGNTYARYELVFRSGSYGTGTPLADGTYIIGVDVVNRTLVGGFVPLKSNTSTAQEITVYNLTNDDARGEEMGVITTMALDAYNLQNYFNLAKFEFRQSKEPTTIQADVDSNFLSKTDLRLFGTISADNLQTSKYVTNDVYMGVAKTENLLDYSDYLVKVKSLVLAKDGGNSVILDGSSTLPAGYMSGYKITRLDDTKISVSPGACRDSSDSLDLKLTTSITKTFNEAWRPGGFSSSNAGGLVPDIIPENLAYRDMHIFAIGRGRDRSVDIAIDTDPSGYNILNSASTPAMQGYTFIKRIGSFYTTKNATENTIISSFSSLPIGNMLKVTIPNTMLSFGNNLAARTTIPAGIPVIAHFTYRNLRTTYGLHSNMERGVVYYVSGSGTVDILLNNGSIIIDKQFISLDSDETKKILLNTGAIQLSTNKALVDSGTTSLLESGPAQSVTISSTTYSFIKSGTDYIATRMNGVGEIIECIGYTDLRGE